MSAPSRALALVPPPSSVPALKSPSHTDLACSNSTVCVLTESGSVDVFFPDGTKQTTLNAAATDICVGVYSISSSHHFLVTQTGYEYVTPSGTHKGTERPLLNSVTIYPSNHVTFLNAGEAPARSEATS